jgi:hypothetical protein
MLLAVAINRKASSKVGLGKDNLVLTTVMAMY